MVRIIIGITAAISIALVAFAVAVAPLLGGLLGGITGGSGHVALTVGTAGGNVITGIVKWILNGRPVPSQAA